jgi:hypothetical protein
MYPTIVPMAETSRPPRPTARAKVESVDSIDRLNVQAWVCQEDWPECEGEPRQLFGCTRNGDAHRRQEIAASLSSLERNFCILRRSLLVPRGKRNRTFGHRSFTYSRMEFLQDETLISVWDPKVIIPPVEGASVTPVPSPDTCSCPIRIELLTIEGL